VIWVEDEERAMLAVWRDMVNKGLVGSNPSVTFWIDGFDIIVSV
jgi:hypothetical protein